jgi:DHA2 family multidrug resistance protein
VNNPNYVQAFADIQTTLHASLSNAEAFFETQLSGQAPTLGLNDVFWWSAVIFVVIIPLIWITRPSKDGAASVAGAGGH